MNNIMLQTVLAVSFNINNFWKIDYINRWDLYLTSYWVPLVLAIIFFGLFIKSFKNPHIGLIVIYLVLTLTFLAYIGFGEESAAVNIVNGIVGN